MFSQSGRYGLVDWILILGFIGFLLLKMFERLELGELFWMGGMRSCFGIIYWCWKMMEKKTVDDANFKKGGEISVLDGK